MQPKRASRRPIIEIDINEVAQGSDNPRTSSRQSSARTSQQRQGSLDQRAARQGTSATGQGSHDPGSLNSHVSQQGSLNPPVAGTGSLDPGSLDQGVASPRTNGSSVSLLPQAPEAAGVAEYIVFAEAVAQDGIDPAGQDDKDIPVALATEALLSQSQQGPTTAVAVSDISYDSTRPPTWEGGFQYIP